MSERPEAAANEETRSKRRTRTLMGVLALLAVLAAFWMVRSTRRGVPEPEAAPSASVFAPSTTATRPTEPRTAMSGTARATPDGSAPEEPFDPPQTNPMAPVGPSAPFPYPPGSQPLTEGANPSTQPKDDDPVDAKEGIHCVFGPRVAVVHPPDAIVIDFEVLNKLGAKMSIPGAVARFRPERSTAEAGPWFSADLVDNGSGKDLAAGDRAYTATYTPSAQEQAAFFKDGPHVYIEVAFEAPNGLGPRKYGTAMVYSREPGAKLNGQYKDSAQGGSLVVEAGVTATKAGDYRVIASLYGGSQAIAFASKTAHLDVGDGNISLLFYGKILYDRGIDGPYELRYMMIFERGQGTDDIPGETVDHAYTTQAYSAKSFSPDAYVQPPSQVAAVNKDNPSQQGKPPPLFSEDDLKKIEGPTAPIKPDKPGKPVPTGPVGTK